MHSRVLPYPRRVIYITVASTGLLLGCGGSNEAAPTSPTMVTTTTTAPPSPPPTARYRVTFDASWSPTSHPNMFPRNPHFSGLIGATHQPDFRLWEEASLASEGMEAMAERGSKTPLDREIDNAISQGRAERLLSGGGIAASPGSVSLEFTVSTEHPAVTLVSMIAPSPDWFVGVSAINMLRENAWVEEIVVELQPYDAGTDSGTTYGARDADTVPPAPISPIDGPPLQVGATVPPLGTFTFLRQ